MGMLVRWILRMDAGEDVDCEHRWEVEDGNGRPEERQNCLYSFSVTYGRSTLQA